MTPEAEAKFVLAYTMLLHAEARIVAHILEPEENIMNIITAHNILEEAKNKVVMEYLPFSVKQAVQALLPEGK